MPLIACRALGPIDLTVDGVPAPSGLHWNKHLALLLYLLRSPRRTRARDHLIGLLWPDGEESKSRHSLNEALRLIRRAGSAAAVETTGDLVRLGDELRLDVDDFQAAVADRDWVRAAALVQGEFAEDFAVPGVSAFDDWLEAERRHWRAEGVAVLVQRSVDLLAAGSTAEAVSLAERALTLDPLSERAAQAVVRSRLLAGDRRGALETGRQFIERLQQDLGAPPSAEILHLLEYARKSPGPEASGRPAAAQSERTPFVGREKELAELVGAWTTCCSTGRAALVVVSGDAGAGTSRLLEELAARAALDTASAVGVRAVEADRGDDASVVAGLATGGLLGLPGVAAAPPAALATFARRFPSWAERYPAARGGGDELDLEAALVAVIRATAEERPLVLLIDDAHRLDGASLRLLPRLLRSVSDLPVLLLLGATSDVTSTDIDELRRLAGREVRGGALTLGALSTRALRVLARAMLPTYGEIEIDRLVRRVSTDSAGLPLLAVELLRAVSRGLELGGSGKAWPSTSHTLDQTLPGELPDAVVAAIRINMRRLGKSAAMALGAAAVLPDRVSVALLAHVTELDRATVEQALDELEWQRWLVAEGRGYSFVAQLVRRVVAEDMLTPGQRRRLLERLESWPGNPPA